MKRSLFFLWMVLLPAACRDESGGPEPVTAQAVPGFTEMTARWFPGAATDPWTEGSLLAPEIMGPGVALLDFDGDGDLDLLQVRMPSPGQRVGGSNRLHRQGPDGTFAPAEDAAGLGGAAYSQGVAVGDADGDGWPDVYFANWGPDALFLNRQGRFVDATERAGIRESAWSTGAAFCDADGDGDQDLFVVRYLDYDPDVSCIGASGIADYCAPESFRGLSDRLYLNDGTGRVVDGSERLGIVTDDGGLRAKGLAVVCTDLSADGRSDFYVANDREANHLWVRRSDGTYVEEAIVRGVAVNRHGAPEASMGLAVGDVDTDGELDLLMTHLGGENNTVYGREAGGLFDDRTGSSGMAAADRPWTGFGCGLFDYDHDGDLDLAVVNGKVRHGKPLPGAELGGFWNRYAEPNLFFRNEGPGRFVDVSGRIGAFGVPVEVTRGLALGDLDRDGDLDIVISNADGSIRAYRNDAPGRNTHWLQVAVRDGPSHALGAQVSLRHAGGTFVAAILGASGYQSAGEPVAHFGLGDTGSIEGLEVTWPDGEREWFDQAEVDRRVELRRGEGRPVR